MAIQLSVAARNAELDAIETAAGTTTLITIRTGAPPANCAAANTGTVLATINAPSDWMSAASGGVKALLGTWQDASADASGTAGHFRVHDTAGTNCHIQGTVAQTLAPINTSALTAANGNVLTFAATTGVVVGMNIAGTGIPADTQVVAVTGTTVTMSRTSTAGVGSAVAITFTADMVVDNVVFAAGQVVNITAFNLTAANA